MNNRWCRIVALVCAVALSTCGIAPAAFAEVAKEASEAWAASAQADPIGQSSWRPVESWTSESGTDADEATNSLASIADGDSNSTWTRANGSNTYTLKSNDSDSGRFVTVSGTQAVGIDVSEWNGIIDWSAVANSGVTYVIVRCGYGDNYTDQDDKTWSLNIRGALDAGLQVGVYLYSYAVNAYTLDSLNPCSAQSEAAHVLRCLNEAGVSPSDLALPVYLDLEDSTQAGLSANELGQIASVFCDTVACAGYDVGIYANLNWWTNHLTADCFTSKGWSRWVARWSGGSAFTSSGVANTDVWQFSNCGKVDGITGNVDMNFDYVFSDYDRPSNNLERLAGDVALGTMTEVVDAGFEDGSCPTVVLATMSSYHDALTASGLAGQYKCPVLITDGQSLSSEAAAEINRLGASNVIVVGGEAAISPTVRSQVASLDCTVSAPAEGATAIETALMIYQAGAQVKSWGNTCVVAVSTGYWDALSASPYAYAEQAPIFLTNADSTISADVLSAIATGRFSRVVVVGGEAAVTPSVFAQLENVVGAGNVVRLGGANAYETSYKIANFCLSEGMNVSHVAYATGSDYYDALTGAAYAGKYESPLLLCDRYYDSFALTFTKNNSSSVVEGAVLGGYAAVSPIVFNRLAAML